MRYIPTSGEDLPRSVKTYLDRVIKVYFNISFGQKTDNTDIGQNISGFWATGTSPATANTQFTVNHQLGRVPVGFDLKRANAAASFYDSGTTWTSTQIFLKASAASVAYTLFIH